MHFQVLREELDKGQKQSFYILTGEEKEVIRQYVRRIDPDIQEAPSFASLVVRFQNVGLFNNGAHGSFVIYNDKTIFDWDIREVLRLVGPDTLVLVYDKIDERVKFFKQAKLLLYEFPKFTPEQLAGYIQKRIDIDYQDAVLLAHYCNNEVSRVDNEIHKLRHAARRISYELIDEVVTPPTEDRIFEMLQYVMSKDAKHVFELYADLKELKESPIKIVSLLYSTFKQVFLVQFMEDMDNTIIAGKTGLTPWQVKKARELVGTFSLDMLLDCLKLIQQTEVAMKTGKVDIDLGMDHLLLQILEA